MFISVRHYFIGFLFLRLICFGVFCTLYCFVSSISYLFFSSASFAVGVISLIPYLYFFSLFLCTLIGNCFMFLSLLVIWYLVCNVIPSQRLFLIRIFPCILITLFCLVISLTFWYCLLSF